MDEATRRAEQRAEEYVGQSTSVLSAHMRALIADAIRADRAACVAAIERARYRIGEASRKAMSEAAVHSFEVRASYCDGTAHGLRQALRMLDEEMAR